MRAVKMTIRDAHGIAGSDPPEPAFWGQLFAGLPALVIVADSPGGSSTPQSETLVRRRKTWVDRLFAGEESYTNSPDKIVILQNGVEIEDVPIDPLGSWTIVGRHPRARARTALRQSPLCRPVIGWPTEPIRASFLMSTWMKSPGFSRS